MQTKIYYLNSVYDSYKELPTMFRIDHIYNIKFSIDNRNWFSINRDKKINSVVFDMLNVASDAQLTQMIKYMPMDKVLLQEVSLMKYKDEIDNRVILKEIIEKTTELVDRLIKLGGLSPEPYYRLYNKKTKEKWNGYFKEFLIYYKELYAPKSLASVYKLFNKEIYNHKGWVLI